MVPIVMRNVGEVMWRGAQVIRPGTVEVVVLPPVDTSALDGRDDHRPRRRGPRHVPRHAGRLAGANRACRAGANVPMSRPVQVTVLGGGSWGTTVASLAARQHARRMLWARDADTAARDQRAAHQLALPRASASCPRRCAPPRDLAEAVESADVLVVGVPSHGIRDVLTEAAPHLRAVGARALAGQGPRARDAACGPPQVIAEVLPGHPVGLLAGPEPRA